MSGYNKLYKSNGNDMYKNTLLMRRVLRLAAKAAGMTSPNPMVGAVLVRGGNSIAEDFHRKPGSPHAEALAIEKAGSKARGSALYVNLEPCCHINKRTPPCTRAIIKSGIKRVVIGMKDPNPKVSGKGIKELQKAGIEVLSGVLEVDAKRLNEAYIKYITTGKPFVTLKAAMTLDGKIATPSGESKWITGEKSREEVRRLRSSVDAVMTAIGTIKADNPQLTARIIGKKDPIRIVIDPELEMPLNCKVLNIPPMTVVITKKIHCPELSNSPITAFAKKGQVMIDIKGRRREFLKKGKIDMLTDKGVRVIEYGGEKLNLNWLMERLGEIGIASVLIEGGSSLNSHALKDGIVDKVMFFIAPKIIGGKDSLPAIGGSAFRKLSEAHQLKEVKVKRIGEDILIEGYIR